MYHLIKENSEPQYQSLPKILASEEYIACDTEFERYSTYFPVPSLLQIAASDQTYIIDLTTVTDHRPLKEIFSNNKLLKILHSGRQDFEILLRLGINPTNLFDSQVAMSFIGLYAKQSFEVLIRELLGEEIDKSQQNSDWMKRPLSKKQLEYAAKDVILLRQCYPKLATALGAKYKDCMEDCEELIYNRANFRINYQKQFGQFAHSLTKLEDIILAYHLVCYREDKAAKENVVRHRILRNDTIFDMINKRIFPAEITRYLESASDKDAKIAIELYEKQVKISRTRFDPKLTALQKQLAEVANEVGLPSVLIASKKDLLRYINGIPCKLDKGWRLKLMKQVKL